jgi:hypothetical protein
MDFEDIAQYEYEQECRENARDIRRSQRMEILLDDAEAKGDCRKCPWMLETLEEFEDTDFDEPIPVPTAVFLYRMCQCCKKHTPEERDQALTDFNNKYDELY